ncbi:MAG: YbdD/YjiX family protein [Rhodospirillaceae bacterium]
MTGDPQGSTASTDTAPSDFMSRLRQTLHLIVHIPDYETYVRHLKETHPGKPVPTQEQFISMCQERRFRQDYLIGKC